MTKLKLYNSFLRKKEEFKPLGKEVLIYVCGITPNNASHLGHAFTYISFDVLVRYFMLLGYKINYLQNSTDINDSDDVIKQAKLARRSWEQEVAYWTKKFKNDMDELNVIHPTNYIFATSVIPEIILVNKNLISKKFAYVRNGNVYFEVSKFSNYGKLSKFNKKQMLIISKERGNNIYDKNKKNPLDFLLWKNEENGPNWNSPWGKGRPGWHIECSTMINKYLGEQIDIHGGGRDLIYPHHESEIAQSEAYTNKKPFVKTWMHTGMVLFEGEKMSKSLGNLVLVSDLLKRYSPNSIRWLILSHHYRNPWEFEKLELLEIEKIIKNIQKKLTKINLDLIKVPNEFNEIMADDLDTPKALEYAKKLLNEEKYKEASKVLNILGFKF